MRKAYQKDAETRFNIAKRILKKAESLKIPRENLVFDCLVMTNSTDSNSARITFETMRKVTREFGVSTTMGASNISYGMPNRNLLNIHFITMAILNGLCAPIADPLTEGLKTAMKAADFLSGRDPYGMNYIADYRK
ncbi:MAG: dihydropteroate synthase [Actinomycetota bacterium]|nr:dihydropteroate synthase [Actinomycetota bacterium]